MRLAAAFPEWCLVVCLAATALLTAPGAARAAIVHDRTTIEIRSADEVIERRTLTIRITDADDVESWHRVPVAVDEHRELVRVEGRVVGPDGKSAKIGRRDRDEQQARAAGILHLSQRIVWLEPEDVVPGSRIEIETEVRERPYFPSGALALGSDDDLVTVEVEVRAAPGVENWRWTLDGDAQGLAAVELERGVRVTGILDDSAFEVPELAVPQRPVLRWGWHRAGEWEQVARWYRELIAGVPRDAAAVRALAAELTSADAPPRARLEDLLAFVRAQVRYVAVEVGVGGYRPSPPGETLERRWGDCKDKSFLLLDLLRAVGIEAHPVLIRLDRWRPVDAEWPDPLHFNHLIVAVETSSIESSSIETTDDDPVADGLLFIDPTQTVGGAGYLHAALHGRDGLVIRESGSSLVRLPSRPRLDGTTFTLDLELADDGSARGTATLRLVGDAAVPWLMGGRNFIRSEVDDSVRRVFKSYAPSLAIEAVRWRTDDGTGSDASSEASPPGVPVAVLEADLAGGGAALGSSSWSLPPGPRLTPDVRLLDEVVELDDGRAAWPVQAVESVVRLRLPPNTCGACERAQEVAGLAGHWRYDVSNEGSLDEGIIVTIRRGGVVERPWLDDVADDDRADDSALSDLRAMAVAEQRALKRRLRPSCP